MDGPATTRVHGYQAHAEHRLLLPAQQRLPPSASDSSNAGIGHDAGVRRLRLRGGGPPLAVGPDDNNHLVDAEFDVEAWQQNVGVWCDVNGCGPQSNVGDVLTYPADDVCSPCWRCRRCAFFTCSPPCRAPDDMCHCVAPAPASAAFLDLNDEDSDVDFTAPVAAVLEVAEGQMLDLNEDNGDDDDDVSDYYTITTYCQNGLRINGSCQSCGAPERASCVCLYSESLSLRVDP